MSCEIQLVDLSVFAQCISASVFSWSVRPSENLVKAYMSMRKVAPLLPGSRLHPLVVGSSATFHQKGILVLFRANHCLVGLLSL